MTGTVSNVRLDRWTSGVLQGEKRPRVAWVVVDQGDHQTFAVVEFELRTSGRIDIERRPYPASQAVPWPFESLGSRQRGSLRVRAGGAGGWTDWSAPFEIVVGLLRPEDWVAEFISPDSIGDRTDAAPVVFRDFTLSELPTEAVLWTSAHGIYEVYLNGHRVGDDVFAPGWRPYRERLPYQRHAVSELLRLGENRLEVLLGNGWFRGNLTWEMRSANYGDRVAALVQLELDFADGTPAIIASDASWQARPSGILANDFYDGQERDLRLPLLGEGAPLSPVSTVAQNVTALVVNRAPSVRETGRVAPVQLLPAADGGTIIDFGQNLVGWAAVTVRDGTPGERVTIRHAEVLEEGRLSVRPLGQAKATCSYLLSGVEREVLQPTFTYSGFRYAEVRGVEASRIVDATAIVLGTDLERTGWFVCSDADLNRLHENAVWSARGNMLSVPTDCPQRAERLGWTGDIQVFAPTANVLFDSSGFLQDWLEDLAIEQWDDGRVPFVVPDVYPGAWVPSAGWGDAATAVPWSLWEAFGDQAVLEQQYDSMKAWVDFVERSLDARGVWLAHDQIGDWLDPDAPPEDPAAAKADRSVVATAYFIRSAEIVSWSARVLGHVADERRYADLADRTRESFDRNFVSADGRITSDCQTVYALALSFDLIADAEKRSDVGARLAELVVSNGYRIGTGFLGTPHVLEALVRAGRVETAYRMLLETECPSWLYPVRMGATTIWERWDSMLPDGSVNPGSMTSFNHYAYGCVAGWMHRYVAGLRCVEPGYRRFEVHPVLGGGLTSASLRLLTVYGRIEVEWRREADRFSLDLAVPFGTEATVVLPDGSPFRVAKCGQHHYSVTLAESDETTAVSRK